MGKQRAEAEAHPVLTAENFETRNEVQQQSNTENATETGLVLSDLSQLQVG